MTPDDALQVLRSGNRLFLNDAPRQPALDRKTRLRLAAGQSPFAAYVTCSDSRVSPELLFGRGLGELFIIRNVGNVLNGNTLGGLEFAVLNLRVPLIVIMGHEFCGAVEAAFSTVRDKAMFPANVYRAIRPIIPVVADTMKLDQDFEFAVRENVRRSVDYLCTRASPRLLELQKGGDLCVVGAFYSMRTGAVDFFDQHGNPL